MGSAGDVYSMPDGSQYALRASSADTDGEYVEFEWILPAGSFAPPPHLHPSQTESYEVLEGQLEVMVDGTWSTLRTGKSATVPVATEHTFKRPTTFTRVRNFHRPALRFEEFIAGMQRICRRHHISGVRDPRLPICLATVWREYPETLQATRTRERIGMGAAAGLARVLRLT